MTVTAAQVKRVVGDEEFAQAWNDKNNRYIILSAARRYIGPLSLSYEDAKACGLFALWRCLQYFNPDFGQKFTTSLYRFVCWECHRELLKQIRYRSREGRLQYEDPNVLDEQYCCEPKQNNIHALELLDKIEDATSRLLVHQYYLEGKTLAEVGRANHLSKEAVRRRIKRSLTLLKEICLTSQTDGVSTVE